MGETRKEPGRRAPASKPANNASAGAPRSLHAERAVIGALMASENAWAEVGDKVRAEDFFHRAHRTIFGAIVRLAKKNAPIDPVTIEAELAAFGESEETGGLAYLIEIAKNCPSAANAIGYAEVVADRAGRRALIEAGALIAELAQGDTETPLADLIDRAEQRIFALADARSRHGGNPERVRPLLNSMVDHLWELHERGSAITGLPTGLTDLDDKTAGLHPGDFVVLAGRPSMGKTALAMGIAEHAAVDQDAPTVVFSMEMSSTQLLMRMVGSLGRVNMGRLRSGQLSEHEWPKVTNAIGVLSNKANAASDPDGEREANSEGVDLYVDETPALSPNDLRARARRVARAHGGRLGLIVIDYLQLMQIPGHREHRSGEISEISRSLKSLAKELNCPVLALSQLNRGVEQRPNKRPVMSDLRESGSLEQDADLVLLLYRDEYYNPDSPDKGLAEIILGKQRNGPTGVVRAAFREELTRFENYAGDFAPEAPPGHWNDD